MCHTSKLKCDYYLLQSSVVLSGCYLISLSTGKIYSVWLRHWSEKVLCPLFAQKCKTAGNSTSRYVICQKYHLLCTPSDGDAGKSGAMQRLNNKANPSECKSGIWVCWGGQVVLFSCESFGDPAQKPCGWSCSCSLCVQRGEWCDVIVQEIDAREKRGICIPRAAEQRVFWVALTTLGSNRESVSLELLHLEDPESWTEVEQTLFYLFLQT